MKKNAHQEVESQLTFDFSGKNWPPQESFPLNLPKPQSRKVEQVLLKDLVASSSFLIITGFTSLSYIIELYDKLPELRNKNIRVALGFEPQIHQRKNWSTYEFSDEVNQYWINKGISPLLSGGVINLLDLIDQEAIQFRISEKMHAKIYVGENHVFLGSSNFSKNGLRFQKEANIRVANQNETTATYESIKLIGENFYDDSLEYARIRELLFNLLKLVTWPEALSKAIAELIEGDWIEKYPEAFKYLEHINLWPSQKMAIGQAIHILDNQGSILVADPTGSGKTRLLACLELALVSRRWQLGKGDETYSKIICPPIVSDNWVREYESLRFIRSQPISSGILSYSDSLKYERVINELKVTNILMIDEAHNYLNHKSARSISLKSSLADCTILATATPINKKAEDLLRLIEMLDIDNLGDDELMEYKKLRKQKSIITLDQTKLLRTYIRKFTVRRTKKQLNELIKREPEKYLNREDKKCSYPEHTPKTYETGETKNDIELAEKINILTLSLKGLINLRSLKLPHNGVLDHKKEVEKRLVLAKALARYQIQSKLRSSKVALVEHLVGTEAAIREFKIPKSAKKVVSGNITGTLQLLATRRKTPKIEFDLEFVPEFLKNSEDYVRALIEEINVYNQILSCAQKMSSARELSKLKKVASLFRDHKLILAFDSSLITLHYLKKLSIDNKYSFNCSVVTGNDKEAKKRIIKQFELGSSAKNQLALCSDAMSEGVNLQQASAVILLDMPSVLRIAEQRIGRVDRMDSPHSEIKVYWPKDSPAFALKSDKRLIKISFMADYLIGSNLDLPADLIDEMNEETIGADEFIKTFKEYQDNEENWDGIHDAFEPVKDLVYGSDSIIKEETYNYYKGLNVTVNCKVSIQLCSEQFGFFAFKGTDSRAPKWVFIDKDNITTSDLSQICTKLRNALPSSEEAEWNDDAKSVMSRYLKMIEAQELSLLPNKKRRALQLLKRLLHHYKKSAEPEKKSIAKNLSNRLTPEIFEDEIIDYALWLDKFISIIQPDLNDLRLRSRYNNPKDISDLYRVYTKENKPSTEQLRQLLLDIPYTTKPSDRISACILGLKS